MAKATLDDILKEQKKQTRLLEKINKATAKDCERVVRPFSPMQAFSSEDEERTVRQIEALVRKLDVGKLAIVDNRTPDTVENMPVLTFYEGDPKYPMLDGAKLRAVKKYDLEAEAHGYGNNTFILRLEMEVQVPDEEEKHGIDQWR